MKVKIIEKLRQRAGESIAETLLGMLIASLALLMLAGAISAATRVITESKSVMTAYYKADSGIVTRSTATGTVTVTLADTEAALTIPPYTVDYYENATIANKPVIAYAQPTVAPTAEP